MVDTRYRAFISYSHSDREWAEWLHRKLENYRVPRNLVGRLTREGSVPRRLTPIFRDREDFPTASDLSAAVESALEHSLFLIVICSPAAAQSQWVDKEIRRFKAQHGERRVLALIVDGVPAEDQAAGGDASECFPPALRFRIGEDGALSSKRAEPLAADIREECDGKKYGLSKIIAGLIGVGLDDLIQREHHRRHIQMTALTGITASIALVMGALTFIAVHARNEARLQRDQAEGLVEFMLTDLKVKLDAVGRLDALDAVGERALDYYAAQNPNALDADSLGRRARAQLLVGEIDNLRGDLGAALKAYAEAAATTEEQLRRDPGNEQRIFDHAQSVFWVGYIAWQRGETAEAEKQFREYLSLAEQLVESDPASPDWQAELGYAYSNLGTLFYGERRWEEAIEFFDLGVELKTRIIRDNPNNAPALYDLAQDYSWIASIERGRGRINESRNALDSEIAIYQQILKEDAFNTKAQRALATARRGLGRIALAQGDLQGALQSFEVANTEIQALLRLEPDNTFWLRVSGSLLLNIGETLALLGEENSSQTAIEQGRDIARGLVQRDGTVMLTQSLLATAELHALKNQDRIRDISYEQSLEMLIAKFEPLISSIENDAGLTGTIAEMHYLLGLYYQNTHSNNYAETHFRRAITLLEKTWNTMGLQEKTLAAKLLVALNRQSEAEVLIEQLDRIKYRHPDFERLKEALYSQPLQP